MPPVGRVHLFHEHLKSHHRCLDLPHASASHLAPAPANQEETLVVLHLLCRLSVSKLLFAAYTH